MAFRNTACKAGQIPEKYKDRVSAVEDDRHGEIPNGWWIYLNTGWHCDMSAAPHTIHEDTWKACMACLKVSYSVEHDHD